MKTRLASPGGSVIVGFSNGRKFDREPMEILTVTHITTYA